MGPTLPFYTSKEIAHQLGLPNVILQGVCTLAMSTSTLINLELDGDPTRVKEIACKFTSMVIPDTKIKMVVNGHTTKTRRKEFFFEVCTDKGKKAIRERYIQAND